MSDQPLNISGSADEASKKKSKSMSVVHTMPEEFFSMKQRQSQLKSKHVSKALLIGLVSLAVILVVVTVSLWLYVGSSGNVTEDIAVNQATNTNVNTNTNDDDGLTTNASDDVNISANDNENTNAPVNANISINGNTNTNTNTNININSSVSPASFLPPSTADTDGDAITDTEELLYGTLTSKPDTDEDSYIDGHEILNFYSPRVATATSLLDDGLTALYTSALHGYSIQYPASWIPDATSDAETEMLFMSNTNEFVEVLVEDNLALLTPQQWYDRQFGDFPDLQAYTALSINGVDAVLGADGATVYIAHADKMYLIHYNFGIRDDVNFVTTYTMMYSSFTLVSEDEPSENVNTNSVL